MRYGLCDPLYCKLSAHRSSERPHHARSIARLSHRRPDLERLGAAGDDDPRRPGRRCHQGRGAGGDQTRAGANRRGGFSANFLNNNRNKRSVVLNLKQPGGARRAEAARRDRRRLRAELPARRRRADRRRRGRDPRRQAEHRLRLDQRLWREGAVCPKAGLRPADPGVFGPGDRAGRLRRGAPADAAHHPARQIDRDHRLAGDHRGAVGARAHRRGAARAAVDAGGGAGVSVGRPTWGRRPLSARRAGAPGGGQLDRPRSTRPPTATSRPRC